MCELRRTLCTGSDGEVSLHSALDYSCMTVPEMYRPAVTALWDALDRDVFLLSDGASLHIYALEVVNIKGPGDRPL